MLQAHVQHMQHYDHEKLQYNRYNIIESCIYSGIGMITTHYSSYNIIALYMYMYVNGLQAKNELPYLN